MPINIKSKKYDVDIQGDFLEREIFEASIAIDGRFSDWDQDERNLYVRTLIKNTQKYILNKGIILPIKDGHDDKTQHIKGYITELRLKSKKLENDTKVACVWARMFLYEPYYKYYREGRYPGISVEISDEGWTPEGDNFGCHLTAAALCGVDMAAYPLLAEELSRGGNLNWFKFVGPKKYYTKEFEKMTLEELKRTIQSLYEIADSLEDSDVKDALKSGIDDLYNSIDSLKGEESKEEKTEARKMEDEREEQEVVVDTDEDAEMKREYSKLKSEKIDLAYEKLAFAGKIGKDQKQNFTKIASSVGLETAMSIYSALETKRPVSGHKIATPDKEKMSQERIDIINKYVKNPNLVKALTDKK